MTRREDLNFRGHIAMLTACILFGLLAPVSKELMSTGWVDAWALTLMRMGGAAVVFWIASWMMPAERVSWHDRGLFFVASLLGIALNQGSYVYGVSQTSPIDASVITATTPIFVMLIAALYLREPITWLKVLGVGIGTTGALLLIFTGMQPHTPTAESSLQGDLFCLLAQASFATYFVLFKRLISRYTPITLMKWMFLFATLCTLPFGGSALRAVAWEQLTPYAYAQIAYIVLGATFVAYLLMPIGQKNLRPTVAASYNYMQPIVATLASVWMGLGSFGWIKAGAMGLVFLGVYVVTLSKSRAQLEAEKQQQKEGL